MAKRQIAVGATSNILDIFIQDSASTTGGGKTGLTATTTSLLCAYKRNTGAAVVDVTLTTQSTLGSYDAAGLKEIDSTKMPGAYEFCPPDAAFATGASSVILFLRAATTTVAAVPLPLEIELTAVNLQDGVRAGLTALPNVVAGGMGGLPIGDTQGSVVVGSYGTTTAAPLKPAVAGRALNVDTNGDVTVAAYATTTVAPLRPTVAGMTLDVSATGEAGLDFDNIKQAAAPTTLTNITVPTTTTLTNGVTVTTNNDKTGYALSSAGVTAVWDEILEGVYTARKIVRGFISALLNKSSGHTNGAASTPKYRDIADTKNRIDAVTDQHGNRSSVTLDLD